jgi:hypothetical protein
LKVTSETNETSRNIWVTDETSAKQTEQPETVEARVKKLRAEGKSYREIAKEANASGLGDSFPNMRRNIVCAHQPRCTSVEPAWKNEMSEHGL